jgi:hypothetical protein
MRLASLDGPNLPLSGFSTGNTLAEQMIQKNIELEQMNNARYGALDGGSQGPA